MPPRHWDTPLAPLPRAGIPPVSLLQAYLQSPASSLQSAKRMPTLLQLHVHLRTTSRSSSHSPSEVLLLVRSRRYRAARQWATTHKPCES